jgi:transcriptional regulator with XRE-family HTH domain
MNGPELRSKRQAAGIPGHAICQRTRIARSRLCGIELGYVPSSPEELRRISDALDEVISGKTKLAKQARALGLAVY